MSSKMYIKEFETLPKVPGGVAQIWGEPCSVEQTPFTVSGTSAASAAFNSKTKFVCITSDVDCAYLCAPSPGTTAVTTTHFPLWSKNYIAFAVVPGQVLTAVLWT